MLETAQIKSAGTASFITKVLKHSGTVSVMSRQLMIQFDIIFDIYLLKYPIKKIKVWGLKFIDLPPRNVLRLALILLFVL